MIYIQRPYALANVKTSQTPACRENLRRVGRRRHRRNLNLIQVLFWVSAVAGMILLGIAALGGGFLLGLVLAS